MIGFYDYTVILTYLGALLGLLGISMSIHGKFLLAILCMAGALVGSVAVFLAVRAWGRRALELFFPREKIDSIAFLRDEHKLHSLVFLLFLIPGTPKDIMTYAVGLTRMQLPAWLLISTFARIPSILTSTAGGDALNLQNYEFALLVFAATLLISGAGLLLYRGLCRARRKEEKP